MATAWGDESVRKTGVPSPMYLMGACVCDDTETETRQRLALLKPKEQGNCTGETCGHHCVAKSLMHGCNGH